MKKISNFLVEKRKIIILAVLAFTVLCGFLIFKVEVNKDMTKYLPDKSSMKKGMDIMNDSFPEAETDNTVRVMFSGLSDGEKEDLLLYRDTSACSFNGLFHYPYQPLPPGAW